MWVNAGTTTSNDYQSLNLQSFENIVFTEKSGKQPKKKGDMK